MDIREARDWVMAVKVAGEALAFSHLMRDSRSVKFVLYPTPEQLIELKIGQSLRMQKKGDPINELRKAGDKMILVVFTD